jgi:molecular chaperone DnaK
VLNVTAKDKSTGKEQSIKIEASSGLTEEDIEKMKKEAEEHAGEDGKKKELIDTRNQAEQLVYTAEKSLKDHGSEIPAEVKEEIENKMQEVNTAKAGDDKAAIDTAAAALSESLQKIGEIMQKAAEEAQAGAADGEKKSEGDKADEPTVHEAEEVKKDEPKADDAK